MSVYFFTSVSLNYVPKARALALSVKEFHPQAKFCLLLAEPVPDSVSLNFSEFDEVITADELAIPNKDSWLFKHNVVETCTAIKGFCLQALLKREDCQSVLYLDPDTVVLSPLTSLLARFEHASILLTPHSLHPEETKEAIFDNEISFLRYGLYNLGFVGVKNSREGRRFSDWWKDRLADYCYSDLSGGLFTDQRWADLVPSFFNEVEIVRDPACNVATWNISNRPVSGSVPGGLTINGKPVLFYHFSGFDSGAQQKMLDKYAQTMPVLSELREWYIKRCSSLDPTGFSEMPWKYDFFDNGLKIKPEHRLIYRMRKDLEDAFPAPFTVTESKSCFYNWLTKNPDELEVLPSARDQVDVFSSKLRKKLNLVRLLKLKLSAAVNRNKNLKALGKNLRAQLASTSSDRVRREHHASKRLADLQEQIFELQNALQDRDRQIATITGRKSWKLSALPRKIERRCEEMDGSSKSSVILFLYWAITGQIFKKINEYKVVQQAIVDGYLFQPEYYWSQVAQPGHSNAAFHYVFLGGAKRGLKSSPLFDTAYYLRSNPDVAASNINPLSHFIAVGAKELRSPNRLFETHYYLSRNAVPAEARQNPLLHFIKSGAQQGFKPCELFDTKYYLEANPDVQQLENNLLEHFLLCGAAEGRKPHPLFDSAYYLKTNPGLVASGRNPLEHFLAEGSRLGLKPHPLFDPTFYAANNHDFNGQEASALEHFLRSQHDALTNPNPLFDCQFYLDSYPDVRATGMNPLVHYVTIGAAEGRKPHPLFDSAYYLRTHPDIAEAKLNPLTHFLETGAKEGRKPHPLFDTEYYLRSNPDVADSGVNPLVHFLQIGAANNRQPHVLFDIEYYQSQLQDDLTPGANPVDHFMHVGVKQGLSPHPLFDTQYYLAENPEVARSKQNPFIHFIELGAKECRNPNPYFDSIYYLREYTDVYHGKLNPFSHYVLIGEKEGRNASPWFDSKYYQEQNPDVVKLGTNSLAHFIAIGLGEGRKPNPNFDPDYYAEQYSDVAASGLNPLLHFIRIGAPQGRAAVPPQRGTQPPYSSSTKFPKQKAKLPSAPSGREWTTLHEKLIQAASPGEPQIDVIVPVYRGYDVTLACIYGVLTADVKVPYELIVINDCSPEPALVERLEELSKLGLFTLIHNEKNLGFVGTVNKGMSLNTGRDVALLNSDAIVYGDWLDRLHSASRSEDRLGTLTPFTNNDPTFCTYPRFNAANSLELELDYAALDSVFARTNAGELVEIPTAVGFCTYIRRDCLNEVGLFDEEAFGRGNGEENDFSQRAILKGWKNKLAANVFVRHIGAMSFLDEKSDLLKQSAAILKKRYPEFFPTIKSFYKDDPVKPLRRKIDIARLLRNKQKPAVLFVTHDRGGGTERHIRDLIEQWQKCDFQTLMMRSDKRIPDLVHITHADIPETPNLSINEFSKNVPEALEILEKLNVRHIHVHHLAGFAKSAPEKFQQIARQLGIEYDFTVHDYTSICPQINLIDGSGKYCGEPEVSTCDACVAKSGSPFGIVSVKDWRVSYGSFLSNARSVFVPNSDVSTRLIKYFPTVHFSVKSHPEELPDGSRKPVPQLVRTAQSPLRVAILGAVGPHKGSKVLLECATDAFKRKLPIEFVLFGYANNEIELRQLSNVAITGPYEDAAIYQLLEEQRCHISFFPAVWPETFSYTLSIAMKANLYPVAFNFGAISERMKTLGWGDLLELDLIDKASEINDRLLEVVPTPLELVPACSWTALYPNSLPEYYELSLLDKVSTNNQTTIVAQAESQGTAAIVS